MIHCWTATSSFANGLQMCGKLHLKMKSKPGKQSTVHNEAITIFTHDKRLSSRKIRFTARHEFQAPAYNLFT